MTLANGQKIFNGTKVEVNYHGQVLVGTIENMRNVYSDNDVRFNLRFDAPTEVMGDVRNYTIINSDRNGKNIIKAV